MSSFKQRGRNYAIEARMQNGSYNLSDRPNSSQINRQRGSSLHIKPTHKIETGKIEKLLSSYGFIECAGQMSRIFFHFSEYNGDPMELSIGDSVEFTVSKDHRSNKPIAVNIRRLQSSEAVVEEPLTGTIECEARPSSPGNFGAETLGRLSYDRNGEFFFLPFSQRDVESGGTLKKGDIVTFKMATDHKNGNMKAARLLLKEPAMKVKVQGIISALKDSFGFVERADVVAEIFFHYSEFDGEVAELTIGDDVEFFIQQRKDKEVAIQVRKLPSGTVAFEDISSEKYRGIVIKPAGQKQNLKDGQLSGVIEYNIDNDTKEVLFADAEGEISLRKGDTVEFNISTDRRDSLQWAVNIKLVQVSVKNGQVRESGVISSLKEGFGFIKCRERDLSLFFHFSQLLEQGKMINNGEEVEFAIEQDNHTNKLHATRIRVLERGTVNVEVLTTENCQGVVDKEPQPAKKLTKGFNKSPREGDAGIILYTGESEVIPVLFKGKDCRPRENPQYGDIVKFDLVTFKRTGQFVARDVCVVQKSLPTRQLGFICALKDSYGFIEFANHEKEVFFHYSELESDPNTLNLADEVEFSMTKRNGKASAERVVKMPLGTIQQEDILQEICDGVVTKPMRIWDPEQDEYEGLIELSEPQKLQESSSGCEDDSTTTPTLFRFAITSLVNKKEPLLVGDKVTFQIAVGHSGVKQHAMNVTSARDIHRGKIESVKGQYGFITCEIEDLKNLFFHMSEVACGCRDLQAGDGVEFVVVRCHKNAKQSAIRIRRISTEPRKPSLRKRVSLPPVPTTFYIIRTPFGPDDSGGFKNRTPDVKEESELACAATSN